MRVNLLFMTIILIFSKIMVAQYPNGTVYEGLKVSSEILGKEVRYTVYLPFDYQSSNRYYPVVYLLHGYTDNDMGWIQFGEANLILDEAIAKRELTPMILIMPDAGVSWYINNFNNSVRYEDFFINEFIPYIEKQYRIRAEKRYRGIAGLSMGGFGSLIYSLRHPDIFTACAAFSAAVYTKEQIIASDSSRWKIIDAQLYGPDLYGEDRLTGHLLSYNPIYLVENSDLQKLKSVKYYLDCGDDDFLTVGNASLHIAFQKRGLYHEYRVRDGMHNWTYWRTGLVDGLKFIGDNFHQR